jgi:hypothetical protein
VIYEPRYYKWYNSSTGPNLIVQALPERWQHSQLCSFCHLRGGLVRQTVDNTLWKALKCVTKLTLRSCALLERPLNVNLVKYVYKEQEMLLVRLEQLLAETKLQLHLEVQEGIYICSGHPNARINGVQTWKTSMGSPPPHIFTYYACLCACQFYTLKYGVCAKQIN